MNRINRVKMHNNMSKFAFFHKSGALTCDFFLYCSVHFFV